MPYINSLSPDLLSGGHHLALLKEISGCFFNPISSLEEVCYLSKVLLTSDRHQDKCFPGKASVPLWGSMQEGGSLGPILTWDLAAKRKTGSR